MGSATSVGSVGRYGQSSKGSKGSKKSKGSKGSKGSKCSGYTKYSLLHYLLSYLGGDDLLHAVLAALDLLGLLTHRRQLLLHGRLECTEVTMECTTY